MAGKKLYTGVVLEDNSIKIAQISISGKTAYLEKLDKIKLAQAVQRADSTSGSEEIFDAFDDTLEDDSVFNTDDRPKAEEDLNLNLDDLDVENDELDLDLDLAGLDDDKDDGDILNLGDMAASELEGEAATSNELVIYNVLTEIDPSGVKLSTNVPAGSTVFQILKDVDFGSIKNKDLQIIVDDRLESLYGNPKGKDYHSYSVREDGSLLLVSVDEEPQTLQLLLSAGNVYSGKLVFNEVIPDEALTIGLLRANYDLDPESITALIQYGEENCRVIFLEGTDILIVSPIIAEGSSSKKFLNTVFSKILFQLDTGEIPNLDRLILCNNTLGDEAISFFRDRFPDIEVSDFEFNENLFVTENHDKQAVASFTTAISMAWADAGFQKKSYPDINFLPEYIKDRQKIFKLQWHGILLLILIVATFPITNFFYQKNSDQITSLSTNISNTKSQITSLESIVQEYNRVSSELSGIQVQLQLLNDLSEGTLAWSTNLNLINKGIDNINSIWFTRIASAQNSTALNIDGIALQRDRIPMVADIFSEAVLLDVSRITIRGQEVFSFKYRVTKIVADKEIYTPESAQGLKQVLGGG